VSRTTAISQLLTPTDTKIQKSTTKHLNFDFVELKVQSNLDFVEFCREILFRNCMQRKRKGGLMFAGSWI